MDLFRWFRSKPEFDVVFGIQKEHARTPNKDSYEPDTGVNINYDEVERVEFIDKLHKAAILSRPFYGVITSEVGNDQHVLTLDVDSTDEMLAACNVIKTYYKLNYVAVMSSPERYWIIVDKVGTIAELVPIMRKIPGVDFKYIDFVEIRKRLVLRAVPKEVMPIFPDEDVKFKNRLAQNWFRAFKDHWGDDVAHYLRLKDLQTAIVTKTMAVKIADPNFMI